MKTFDGINRLTTIEDRSGDFPVTPIGNDWSREYFDGPFYLFKVPPYLPAISLVFVESANGNTGADNPADLGGGPTDLHLIYEGLSRVAADAVLAGARSVGPETFFTVHHPELIALRQELRLPRDPIQLVLSRQARPSPSRLVSGTNREEFARLKRERGIRRISCIGGRHAATSLVDAGLVQDIYLTTTAFEGGESGTPWYAGERPPRLETIVRKREAGVGLPIVFQHLAVLSR